MFAGKNLRMLQSNRLLKYRGERPAQLSFLSNYTPLFKLLLFMFQRPQYSRMEAIFIFDVLQLVLVVCALLVDALALWAILARISAFGFSPNRVAAFGENLILVVSLGWSAVLYARFVRSRGDFRALERWQTRYLPVYAVWAWIVVVIFPLVFGFQ